MVLHLLRAPYQAQQNRTGNKMRTLLLPRKQQQKKTIFRDSELAHNLLDELWGIEIGGSAHNPFNLPHCLNVDYIGNMDTVFKRAEKELCGTALNVDIIASGDDLPFKDNTLDYVVSSHVIEHFFDPISTMKEWYRVIRPGGFIFCIVPHVDRVQDETRPVTPLHIIKERHHSGRRLPEDDAVFTGGIRDHYTVFDLGNFLEMCDYLQYRVIATEDPDKKVGNGFTVVVRK